MNQGFRRLLSLVAVFALAFCAVVLMRDGPAGLLKLFHRGGGSSDNHFRPEKYTLPDKAPLEDGDVELLARLDAEYEKVTDAVTPSVVSIDTAFVRAERQVDFLGRQSVRAVPSQGQGSGVIVSKEGHIVTNHHVIAGQVAGQENIQVRLHDGRKFPAVLVGDDEALDIAVLKIQSDGAEFQPLKFGDSSKVRRGQLVFAIGNPFGLGETITQGIISAVERTISENQRDLFQTDAAINPGNSGGPLVNLRGEIIGINSAIYSTDTKNPGFQGVGFAIPANDVKDTLSSILERGRPVWGYLGVEMQQSERGVLVSHAVAGGPADAAGFQPEDLVTSYDGQKVKSISELMYLVKRTKVGRQVPVEVKRHGQELTLAPQIVESNPDELAARNAQLQSQLRDLRQTLTSVGIKAGDLSARERSRGFSGVVVMEVLPGSLAEGKLAPGDLIVALNDAPVVSAEEFYQKVAQSAPKGETSLRLIRNGKEVMADLPAILKKDGETAEGHSH